MLVALIVALQAFSSVAARFGLFSFALGLFPATIGSVLYGKKKSLLFGAALRDHNVPFEMHIWPAGPHGGALCNEQTASGMSKYLMPDAEKWVSLACDWAKNLKV